MSAKEAGELLRRTREERNLVLADAAKATRIRAHFLQALEDGELGLLPSPAQVRGFLRTYAIYLGLAPNDVLDLLQPRAPQPAALEQQAETSTGQIEAAASAPAGPALSVEPSAEIDAAFASISAQLRQRRESLELTLPEAEQSTFIPEHYLRQLESGDFNAFPSPTQARGMLSNYAEFLGLESNALLMLYAEALQTRFKAKAPPTPRAPRERPRLVFRLPPWASALVSRDVIFGGSAGLLLLLFVIWSIGRVSAAVANQEPEPTAPPLTGLLLSTPQPTAGSATVASTGGSINLLEQQTPTPGLLSQATIEAGAFGNISLRLISLQRNWMRVTADGQIQFEGRTLPGQSYPFNANGEITLLTGNAAGFRAFLNEQDLGILGIYGEVITIVFTQSGAATPTLSPTPTIDPGILTATADFALTPSPTATATTTPSPQPSATSEGND